MRDPGTPVGGKAGGMTEALVLRAARTHWTARVAPLAVLWSTVYGAVQVWFALGHAPEWDFGIDLFVPGWGTVALCAAAGSVVAGLTAASRWSLVVAAWAVAATLAGASGLLLLDAVGTLIPGMDIPVQPAAVASRLGAAGLAVLVGATALSHQRRLREACASCGRTEQWWPPAGTPRWAWVGAYAAVAGCVVRLAAQYVVGWDDIPYEPNASLVVFEVLFVLAGTVLPLGLVHHWGRVWPRWVLPVAGRRVPRWLPLGPAVFLSIGITAYFGIGLGGMVVDAIQGKSAASGPFSAGFFWVAVPSYVVWGIGLGLAAVSYARLTRPVCRSCHRG